MSSFYKTQIPLKTPLKKQEILSTIDKIIQYFSQEYCGENQVISARGEPYRLIEDIEIYYTMQMNKKQDKLADYAALKKLIKKNYFLKGRSQESVRDRIKKFINYLKKKDFEQIFTFIVNNSSIEGYIQYGKTNNSNKKFFQKITLNKPKQFARGSQKKEQQQFDEEKFFEYEDSFNMKADQQQQQYQQQQQSQLQQQQQQQEVMTPEENKNKDHSTEIEEEKTNTLIFSCESKTKTNEMQKTIEEYFGRPKPITNDKQCSQQKYPEIKELKIEGELQGRQFWNECNQRNQKFVYEIPLLLNNTNFLMGNRQLHYCIQSQNDECLNQLYQCQKFENILIDYQFCSLIETNRKANIVDSKEKLIEEVARQYGKNIQDVQGDYQCVSENIESLKKYYQNIGNAQIQKELVWHKNEDEILREQLNCEKPTREFYLLVQYLKDIDKIEERLNYLNLNIPFSLQEFH